MPIGRIFEAQTISAWIKVEIGVCSLDFVFDRNNNGRTSLKRQKSPEITADLHDVNKFH